jgi:hypothetical protein
MSLDKVQPVKYESTSTGGDGNDKYFTDSNPQADFQEIRGVVLCDASNRDETTVVDRNANDMRFKDGNNTTALTLSQLAAGATYSAATGEPLGFVDRTSSQISWNNTNKSLSLAVKSPATEFVFYEPGGVKYTKTTTQTATLSSPAAGKWYFYFSSGTLTYSSSLPAAGFKSCFVAIVVLDASNNIISLGDERHGVVMDWKTHEWAHDTIGTRWETGLATARIATGSGAADGDAQVYVGGGTTWDEDIEITVARSASPANDFEQELGIAGTPGKFPIYYRSSTGSDNWVKRTADNYPIFQNAGGERIVYNKNTTGTWSTTQISANSNYGVVYLVATNSITDPVIAILGQAEYANPSAASAATFADLSLGNLPFQEMKPIAKLTYKTSTGYANSVKAYVAAVTDLRNAQSLPSGNFVATDHNSLTGRDAARSHPATAVETDTTNFAGILSTADTNVQLALDTIGNHTHSGYQAASTALDEIIAPQPGKEDSFSTNAHLVYDLTVGKPLWQSTISSVTTSTGGTFAQSSTSYCSVTPTYGTYLVLASCTLTGASSSCTLGIRSGGVSIASTSQTISASGSNYSIGTVATLDGTTALNITGSSTTSTLWSAAGMSLVAVRLA